MVRSTDELGRIVIPVEMRKELGIENGSTVNIELKEDEIIITNPKRIDYKAKTKKAIEYIENDLQSFLYSAEYKKLLEILKEE